METTNTTTLDQAFIDAFAGYANDSVDMASLKERLENNRRILEPVIKAHKIPVDDNKAWKAVRPVLVPLVDVLEASTPEQGKPARKAAWLGVLRTCLEFQILPTQKNADRFRKLKTWVALNGNGKLNPNWVDPKAKAETVPETQAKTSVTTAAPVSPATPQKATATPNALALATMQPGANKADVKPLHATITPSNDAPITPREHLGILLDQLTKNEAFRAEYCPTLALMMDVEVSTLTRCIIQARDTVLNGAKP